MKNEFPQYLTEILRRLKASGFSAYAVGGCVRDALLDRPCADFDVACSALPEQVKRVFPECRFVDTGLKHGTITMLCGGGSVEITTFRRDGKYTDLRRPDSVRFCGNFREDASRRDFTVNAMGWAPDTGLVDFFGGQDDLRACLIRCVGCADTRFEEDPLRILRALRFASVLGFTLETKTAAAALRHRQLLQSVAAERVAKELAGLLCGANVRQVLMQYPDIVCTVLPELAPCVNFPQHNRWHCYDVYEHTAIAVECIPAQFKLRLAALLHDSGKPMAHTVDDTGADRFIGHPKYSERLARAVVGRLKLDSKTAASVCALVKHHDVQIENTQKAVRRALAKYSSELFFDILLLKRADTLAQSPDFRFRLENLKMLEQTARGIISAGECLSQRTLAVSGKDLILLGYPEGELIGAALRELTQQVVEGSLPNVKRVLLSRALQILKAERRLLHFEALGSAQRRTGRGDRS